MSNAEKKSRNEQKMEQISAELEDLVLDAFIAVINRIKHRTGLLEQEMRASQEQMKF